MIIYKIFRPAEWDALNEAGQTDGAPIDIADGYIHFSTASQTAETLTKHFGDLPDLIVCGCDTDDLGSALKWEASRGGALFPHLYRKLDMSDVRWHATLPLVDGIHQLPAQVR